MGPVGWGGVGIGYVRPDQTLKLSLEVEVALLTS